MQASTSHAASIDRVDRQRRFGLARSVTAIAVLISAIVHFQQYLAGYSAEAVIGPLFLLNAAGGLVIAVVIVAWRHWLPTLLGAGFGALTLVTDLPALTLWPCF
jgi:hypothetical protein